MAKPEQIARSVDARGMACPMPVVRANKAMKELAPGEILELLATDKGSKIDIPAWCKSQKHELLHMDEDQGIFRYYVRKGS